MGDACIGESQGLAFWLATAADYEDVMAISEDIYDGNDYLPYRYHAWLEEPQRVVLLARRNGKLMALESGLVVDDGKTVVVEGLRVSPSERGQGVAGIVQRFTDQYLHQLYPSLRVKRMTRNQDPGPDKLSKFRLLDRRAILSLRGEAKDFDTFVSTLRTKLSVERAGDHPRLCVLQDVQLKQVILEANVTSRFNLPGGLLIQDWQPLQPTEGNLQVLGRRNLTWLADSVVNPSFLSLATPPYRVPYGGGSLRFNIDLFGVKPDLACWAFLDHIERVKAEIEGTVLVHVYMACLLWEELRNFCRMGGLQPYKEYWEQILLEQDL